MPVTPDVFTAAGVMNDGLRDRFASAGFYVSICLRRQQGVEESIFKKKKHEPPQAPEPLPSHERPHKDAEGRQREPLTAGEGVSEDSQAGRAEP